MTERETLFQLRAFQVNYVLISILCRFQENSSGGRRTGERNQRIIFDNKNEKLLLGTASKKNYDVTLARSEVALNLSTAIIFPEMSLIKMTRFD